MKIIAVCSHIDLSLTPSTNTIYWQLFKALYVAGTEVIVVPHQGHYIESLWWRGYENPARTWIDLYNFLFPFKPTDTNLTNDTSVRVNRLTRKVGQLIVKPTWKRLLWKLLQNEPNTVAVIFFGVGLIHLKGLAREIRRTFNIPVIYFDVETPSDLPEYYSKSQYLEADLSEYDAFIVISKGAAQKLKEMGASNVEVIYCAADPDVFRPLSVEKDIDVLFPGWGTWGRKEWIRDMLVLPSKMLPQVKFAVLGDVGSLPSNILHLRPVSFPSYGRTCARGKIVLNISRKPVVETYASSNLRLFELAAIGACIVTNPCLGLEEFFSPGKELYVAGNLRETIELYRWLLSHDDARNRIGLAARQRVLKDHTYRHRAEKLQALIKSLS